MCSVNYISGLKIIHLYTYMCIYIPAGMAACVRNLHLWRMKDCAYAEFSPQCGKLGAVLVRGQPRR